MCIHVHKTHAIVTRSEPGKRLLKTRNLNENHHKYIVKQNLPMKAHNYTFINKHIFDNLFLVYGIKSETSPSEYVKILDIKRINQMMASKYSQMFVLLTLAAGRTSSQVTCSK